MPCRIFLFHAFLNLELCHRVLLPSRLNHKHNMQSWVVLQHDNHDSKLHQRKLLSIWFNRHEPMPSRQCVQHPFKHINMRARFVLPDRVNAAESLRFWECMPEYYSSAHMSYRDSVHCWFNKRDRLPCRDVLRCRKCCGRTLSCRKPMHIEQHQGRVSSEQLL
jgi:hypothetical protein